ncbi:MAG: hypothetical protein VX874_03370 [Pseudomonadota bacterium]|nr:hypothetical protein [Pseudomonadota bacterium]
MSRSQDGKSEARQSPTSHRDGSAKVARLRDEIDSGRSDDKVAARDPAAAPLGTDAEAGGHPPTAAEADRAADLELGRDVGALEPGTPDSGTSPTLRVVLVVLIALVIGAAVWVVTL